ncbi:hypothetical protein niasHS_012007 [Heterodera schachtii]|uniref:Vps16 C-terminal domain-containing protein n=1 Tax=Heterodera schachtii TaxID=97005 RepID=A0ABD2ICD4_HETSC
MSYGNPKNLSFPASAAGDGDAEADPYWWEQSTSSRNLMDSIEDGLWDGLFQEKTNSFTLEHWENKLCIKEENDGKSGDDVPNPTKQCQKQHEGTPLTKELSPTSSARSGSVSLNIPSSIPTRNTALAENTNGKFSSSHNTEGSSTRESNNSNPSQALSDVTIHLDYARLKAEHRKLKKYFESACESRYKTPPVRETIRRLNRAEPVALDLYRLHSEKMELLREALEECDWDGIITVLLFIKRTLSNALFRQCLMEHPKAARHYVTYLRECGDSAELADTLFGSLEALRNCLLSGFSHPQLANERRSLEEWIALLETHLKRPS